MRISPQINVTFTHKSMINLPPTKVYIFANLWKFKFAKENSYERPKSFSIFSWLSINAVKQADGSKLLLRCQSKLKIIHSLCLANLNPRAHTIKKFLHSYAYTRRSYWSFTCKYWSQQVLKRVKADPVNTRKNVL